METTKNCAACGGCTSCGGCAGCGSALFMTEVELTILDRFAENPFLPLGRKYGSEEPVHYMDGSKADPAALTGLALKGLITLDYDMPIQGFDYADYAGCDEKGSMALTLRGQEALDALEIMGIEE